MAGSQFATIRSPNLPIRQVSGGGSRFPSEAARSAGFPMPGSPQGGANPQAGFGGGPIAGGIPNSPTSTQWATNAAKGAAVVDPHWLRTQFARPGASMMSPNTSMNILKPLADSYAQQGLAQAMVPFGDHLANNQFALNQYGANAQNSLAQQNIGAGVQASNQSALLTLLNAMLGG